MKSTSQFPPALPSIVIDDAVRTALAEDLGRAGDITSNATIAADARARGEISAREPGTLCGIHLARAAFLMLDPTVEFRIEKSDCEKVGAAEAVAGVEGNARSILGAERVALNYLMRMSGIATYTARFQQEIAHTKARICCTRKTVPGQRALDKYAVRCGGGANHRFGLDDAVLIKDNHIAVCGGVRLAIERARAHVGHLVAIEAEVDSLDQFAEALEVQPEVILLDNMSPDELRQAVALNKRHARPARLEASGNVAFDTVREIAETGVDFISTSKITMAAPTLDLGFDISIQ